MKDQIRLIAEYSLTYAPHNVADKLGFFEDADIDLATSYQSGPGGSWLSDVLGRGEADIARGGVWIPMMYRGYLDHISLFAALCHRNAQVLLSRELEPDFALTKLVGRRVLLPLAATSQWMYLRGVCEEQGLDWWRVNWLRDLETSTMVRLWRSGFADHILVSPPVADQLLEEGYHAALQIADTGVVPWSVYYAKTETVAERSEPLIRFTAALGRASAWIRDASAQDTARLLAEDFPQYPLDLLTRSIDRMRRQGTWQEDMRVPEAPLARYGRMIAAYGLISEPLAFEAIVAPQIAEAALRRDPALARSA